MSLSTVRSVLIADPTVGGVVGEKVYVGFAPQELPTPFLLLEEVYRSPNDCKGSPSVKDSYGFLVTAVDKHYKVVEDLLQAVRSALDMYSDETFDGITYESLQEEYDGTQDYFVKTYSFKSLINVL